MSYILDALRRADAERQHGAVPGLHDQPLGRGLDDATPQRHIRSRRLGLAALALALLVLAAAGWLLRPAASAAGGQGPSPGAVPAALPGPAAKAGPAAGLPAALPGLSPAAAPAVAVAQPQPPEPLPVPVPTVRAWPPPLAVPASRGAASRQAAAAASATTPLPEPLAPVAPPPVAPPPARLPTLAELPEAQRRELGPLVVGGSMHAEQAALRIVILNGQVVHEGDKLGPELQVQQIRLKSVVMSHRGQRFELPF